MTIIEKYEYTKYKKELKIFITDEVEKNIINLYKDYSFFREVYKDTNDKEYKEKMIKKEYEISDYRREKMLQLKKEEKELREKYKEVKTVIYNRSF